MGVWVWFDMYGLGKWELGGDEVVGVVVDVGE